MILTLTPNPSVDRTVFLDTLTLGSVNRSTRSWNEPSGKGINVALALLSHRKTVRAVLPVGGSVGAQLRQMLSRAELDTARIPIAGEIRTNISLAQPDGTVTKINETGPRLDQTEVDALIDAVAQHLDGADWLVCGGSLPAGVPDDFYATLVELAHHKGVPVVVDSSGAPLAASLPARPDLIKPNVHELAELVHGCPTSESRRSSFHRQRGRSGIRTTSVGNGGRPARN
jgi:1-phosphofructokinase